MVVCRLEDSSSRSSPSLHDRLLTRRMDVVSWSTSRSQESFSCSTCATTCTPTSTPTSTLSRLASFIARSDPKKPSTTNRSQQPSHSPSFICGECGRHFSHAVDVLQHQEQEHSLPKPHQCLSCGMEFSLKSSLQLHRCDRVHSRCERCQSSIMFGSPCPTCRTRNTEPSRLPNKPHVLEHSPYTCAPCGKCFSQKQALLHHQQTGCSPSPSTISLPGDSPPGDSSQSDSDSPDSGSDTAGSCHLRSGTFGARDEHKNLNKGKHKARDVREEKWYNGGPYKKKKSKKKKLTCRSCDMVFSSTTKLYVHRKEQHRREKILKREQRPAIVKRRKTGTYPCQICGKVFFHHLSLRAHFRRHVAPYNPEAENKVNSGTVNQVEHVTVKRLRGRPRKKPFVLSHAHYPVKSREVPDAKKEIEEEKEFPCPSCAEVFPLQRQLNEHMDLHQSSLMQRQCSVCMHDIDSSKWSGSKRQRLYHCVPCQQGFSELDAFLQHCQEHLRAKVDEDRMSCTQLAGKASHTL